MAPMSARLYLLLTIQAALLGVARGKVVQGYVDTKENWVFLSRFCFLSEESNFEYMIEYDKDIGIPNLLFYNDDNSQWPSVHHSSKTCEEREAVAGAPGQNQIISLSYLGFYAELSGCVISTSGQELPDEKSTITTTEQASTKTTTPERETTISDTNSTTWDELLPIEDFDYPAESSDENSWRLNSQSNQQSLGHSPRSGGTGRLLVTCRSSRRFRTARERWWYFAISNCNSSKGLDVTYMMLMTNGAHGDFWQEHFSADELYVLPVLLGFTCAYAVVIIAVVVCSFKLKSRHLFHSTYKLFVASVVVQLTGVVVQSLAYVRYALIGIESNNAKIVGQFFCSVSESTFLLLLVLLAKGYTITRDHLKAAFTATLAVIACSYMLTYVVLFIYQAMAFEAGEVLHLYESPAGYGLIVLRIVAWLVFTYSTYFTVKKYPEKMKFYLRFFLYGTLWFFAGPLLILAANFYIEKWQRESLVVAALLSITLYGHIMFLVLTLPCSANKCFPYHIPTTQNGDMTDCGEDTNQYTLSAPTNTVQSSGEAKVDKKKPKENSSSIYNSLMGDISDAFNEKEKVKSTVHTETILPDFMELQKPDFNYSSHL